MILARLSGQRLLTAWAGRSAFFRGLPAGGLHRFQNRTEWVFDFIWLWWHLQLECLVPEQARVGWPSTTGM